MPSDDHGAAGAADDDFEVKVSYGSRRERRAAEREVAEREAAALRSLQERDRRATEEAAREASRPEPGPEPEPESEPAPPLGPAPEPAATPEAPREPDALRPPDPSPPGPVPHLQRTPTPYGVPRPVARAAARWRSADDHERLPAEDDASVGEDGLPIGASPEPPAPLTTPEPHESPTGSVTDTGEIAPEGTGARALAVGEPGTGHTEATAVPPEPSPPDRAPEPFAASVMPVPTGAQPGEPSRRARRTQQVSTPAPSRAGRNLPAAIAVGCGLGVVIAASLFIRKEAFVALLVVALCLGVWELTQAFAARRIAVPLVPILVGTVGMQVSAYAGGQEALLVAFVLTALSLLLWRVLDGVEGAVRDVAAGVFTSAYGPFLAGFAALMLAAPDGEWRIFTFMIVAICSDVGGYVFGVLWGRHPLAPSVSPKKSWEGLAGSVVFGMVGGVVSVVLALDGPWWAGLVVGVAAVVTATVGDLSESLLKRDLGIKDMGSLLPGHGGIMDRLDSLLPTAPVVYLLLALLVPVAG